MSSDKRARREEMWRRRLDPTAKPRREPITVDRIVDAAFRVMATEGYAAVSMRRVAQELGTGPASLYAHVDNKEELDALLVDRMAAGITLPEPDPEHWQQQVIQLGRDLRAAMAEHPGIARAVMARVPVGNEALRTSEGMLAILLAGGVHEQVAAWACDLLPLYVTAVAFEESIWAGQGGEESPGTTDQEFVEQLRRYFETLPPERFPHLVASAVALTTGGGDERFEFGMRVIVSGLQAVSDSWPERPR